MMHSQQVERKMEVREKLLDAQRIIEDYMYRDASLEDFRFIRVVAKCLVDRIDLGMEAAGEREWQKEKAEFKRMYVEHEAACLEEVARMEDAVACAEKELNSATNLHMKQMREMGKKLKEQEAMLVLQKQKCDAHKKQVEDLKEQIEEDNTCNICRDNPRDTWVLPCSHFQYCLRCLLQHKTHNGSTCPTCRGPMKGLCMAASANSHTICCSISIT
ncbi:hypothetical protein L7F22_063235 [Adiantum nelumboides]|nr:hypothetical protein [Adiantum nelumboides]